MSALYGSMTTDASRGGGCTRRGHKYMSAHVRGWHEGVETIVGLDDDGKVFWKVYRTGGSNGSRSPQLVAEGREGE